MEIDFNPGRMPKSDLAQSVPRQGAAPAAADGQSVAIAGSLHAKLQELPLVRSDKVAHAQSLLADTHYPPDYVFSRIAALLAIHLSQPTDHPLLP